MNWILLGNILSLIGCSMMVAVGFVQQKRKVLLYQCAQLGVMFCSNFVLGAASGAISNALGIVRNLVFAKTEGSVWLKLAFVGIQIVMTLFGWKGPIEILPILATVVFIWLLDTKNDVVFKLANVCAMVMWCIYDFYYHNYVASVLDVLTIISNCVAIVAIHKKEKAPL